MYEKQRSNYTHEEEQNFIVRAKDFITRNPEANRTRISGYVGVGVGVLLRLEASGEFKLPKAMTTRQVRKKGNWGNTAWSVK